jgi:mRNA-degrading endonuclease RelE of RelBE toxin-antitoxin system
LKHFTSSDFWKSYNRLPADIRELADKNYDLLKQNPRHPSLKLKRIEDLWSVRVGQHYRAIGIDAPGGIQWIWIGSHAEYDKYLTQ